MTTAQEKKMATSIGMAILKAMQTLDAHEGRFMKTQLKLEEALEDGPTHRKYVHTKKFWAKKAKKNKSKFIPFNSKSKCPACQAQKNWVVARKIKTPEFHCSKCGNEWSRQEIITSKVHEHKHEKKMIHHHK